MPEPDGLAELNPFEAELLRMIGSLFLDGVKTDVVVLIMVEKNFHDTGEQTWEEAVAHLHDAGLVKKTLTGKYRPTRLGLAWLNLDQPGRYSL